MTETSTQDKPKQEVPAPDATVAAPNVAQVTPDVLDQLLKPEVQESLTYLVESLPKLTEIVSFLTKAYDFTQAVATDRLLREDLTGGLSEVVKPVQQVVKDLASATIEAKERAEADQTTIGVFGLIRMLKDPQMQQVFRFTQAFLDILAERKK